MTRDLIRIITSPGSPHHPEHTHGCGSHDVLIFSDQLDCDIVMYETFPRVLIVRDKKIWRLYCNVRGVSDGSMVDILQVSGSRIQGLVPPPVS